MKIMNLKLKMMAAIIGSGLVGVGMAGAQVVQPVQPVSYRSYQPTYQPYQEVVAEGATGCSACEAAVEEEEASAPTRFLGLGTGRRCGELGDPWTLFGRNCDDPCLNIGGWFQGGLHTASNDLFNSNPDRLNLHQAWLFVEKEAVSENGELGLGFRFDGMYGTDFDDTNSFGNNPGNFDLAPSFARGGGYGWALPQVYMEVAKGDWNVKIGHFFTLIGYEVVTAPDNFFYSHAMTMYNSEPFTHTGAIASYAASDDTTYYGGWTAGWDTGFDQFGNGSNFLGGVSTALGEYVTGTYMTTIGDFGARGSQGYMQSVVLDMTMTEKMNYVIQSDLLRVDSTGEDTFGINQYVFYDVNDRLKLGSRMEWWKADVLTGYAPHGGTLPASGNVSYWNFTNGLNYKVNSNIVVRPEYRYDFSEGADYDQGIFGFDMIATY